MWRRVGNHLLWRPCSIWYAYELGAYAAAGVGLVSRQTLVGGAYELVDDVTVMPYPDYYVALLWKRLVGSQVSPWRHSFAPVPPCVCPLRHGASQVLSANLTPSAPSSPVRAFAHCAYGGTGSSAGIVAVLVNFALNETASVSIAWGAAGSAAEVGVYQLQPLAGPQAASGAGLDPWRNGASPRPVDWYRVALNGQPLDFSSGGPVPATPPVMAPAAQPLVLGPATVTLVTNAGAGAGVCSGH